MRYTTALALLATLTAALPALGAPVPSDADLEARGLASSIWGSVKSVGKDVLSRTGKGLIDKVLGGGHSSGYSSGYDDSYGSEDYGSEDDGSEGEYSDYRKRDSPMDNDEDAEVERRGFVGLESELD